MEYNKLIAEMSLSDEVEGFYVLKAAYPKMTATGKPFLSASLSDRSGSIEIKVWDYSGPISSVDEGNVVKIRGTVSEFRGTPQITVDRIRLADEASTDCHAATVGLTLDKPVIVGAANAVSRLTDGTVVTVDCVRGLVCTMP